MSDVADALQKRYRDNAVAIAMSIRVGIIAEQDWEGPSIKEGDLTEEQIDWLASWLAGESWVKK
jgi:hypothetical protein